MEFFFFFFEIKKQPNSTMKKGKTPNVIVIYSLQLSYLQPNLCCSYYTTTGKGKAFFRVTTWVFPMCNLYIVILLVQFEEKSGITRMFLFLGGVYY